MAKIKNVDIQSDKVVITFEKDYMGYQNILRLACKYYITLRDDWGFNNMHLERYFINNGKKGCYIGKRKSQTDNFIYDVWDLTKIFPNVHFNDNTEKLKSFIEF